MMMFSKFQNVTSRFEIQETKWALDQEPNLALGFVPDIPDGVSGKITTRNHVVIFKRGRTLSLARYGANHIGENN